MKNWLTVEPDLVRLTQNFTPGRGGQKIEYITRHHTAGPLTTEACYQTWLSREASAHYCVEDSGRIGQLVWDRDTAWANNSSYSNQRTIAIEHASRAPDWYVTQATIIQGARLAAALCLYYGLGRPEFGKNIRDHGEFTSTGCPWHLARGGKYHSQWMRESLAFYDTLAAMKNVQTGKVAAPSTTTRRGTTMAELTQKYFSDYIQGWGKGFFGPQFRIIGEINAQVTSINRRLDRLERLIVETHANARDNRIQLSGSDKDWRGWSKIIGTDADGTGLTVVEGLGAIRKDIATLNAKLEVK